MAFEERNSHRVSQVRDTAPRTCMAGRSSEYRRAQTGGRVGMQFSLQRGGYPPALQSHFQRKPDQAPGPQDLPSASAPTLRTHVLITADITACTAGARSGRSGPLVPHARGRRMRRLGGRPERASCAGSPAPSAAAQAVFLATPGRHALVAAGLHLPHLLRPASHARDRRRRARERALRAPWLAGRAHGDARGPRPPRQDRLRQASRGEVGADIERLAQELAWPFPKDIDKRRELPWSKGSAS
jgi:hypothetical protein